MITPLSCRLATPEDEVALWELLEPVFRLGGTYVFATDTPKEVLMAYWMGRDKTTFLIEREGLLLGTFYLKANQEGFGDHICNAGFVVDQKAEGQGVGTWMGLRALEEAKDRGFLAMQFNFVIQTNQRALGLWASLGFNVIGEIPDAYRHPQLGMVSAFILYRKLQ
jgi:GNAT superfamily N-acetyltransferase